MIPPSSFVGGVNGWWYKYSDLDTLWKNNTNTVPVRNHGDVIAKAFDKSPHGRSSTQSTVASRPVLAQTRGGFYGAGFDGADDFMPAPVSVWNNAGATTIIAAVQAVDPAGLIYGEGNSGTITPFLQFGVGGGGATGFGDDPGKLGGAVRSDGGSQVIFASQEIFGDGRVCIVALRIHEGSPGQRIIETWINGRQQSVATHSGAMTLNTRTIGALIRTTISSYFRGVIFEIIGIEKALHIDEMREWWRYLDAEYPERQTAAGTSTAVHPRVVDYHGRLLLATTTRQGAARVTVLSDDGLPGPAYSSYIHGSMDAHSAAAAHKLADGRLLMISATHNSSPLAVTVSNPEAIISTVPFAAPAPWPIARAEVLPGVLPDASYPRVFETPDTVHLFVRSRAVGETHLQRGLWRFDTPSTMASPFANPVKLVGGNRPYVYIAQADDVFDCLMSSGNPGDMNPENNIYHGRHDSATNTMHLSDDTAIPNGSDVSEFTVLHDQAVDGRPASTGGRPWYGRDGFLRVIYYVYNPDGSQELVFRRLTPSGWSPPLVIATCAGSSVNNDIYPVYWFVSGGFDADPNNPDVVYISRNVGPAGAHGGIAPHQIWRFTCRDGLDAWDSGVQMTNDPTPAVWPACSERTREPRVAYLGLGDHGMFSNFGDVRCVSIHS